MPDVYSKEYAHALIDRMAPGQVAAMVGVMEMVLDPVARSIASAPWDDEPVSEEEQREIAVLRAAFARGEGICSHEEVLAEFGLTVEDFERMGRMPLEGNGSGH